jgi:hypothetical protein
VRFAKTTRIIEQCTYGVHDISSDSEPYRDRASISEVRNWLANVSRTKLRVYQAARRLRDATRGSSKTCQTSARS